MITTNVIQRVFHLRVKESTGTVFALDHEGKQYLITASHVLKEMTSLDEIEIFHGRQWKGLPTAMVGIAESADIAVLAPKIQLAPPYQLEATMGGMLFGQQVYFLGFPLGMMGDSGQMNRDFPFPLVKSGILSGVEVGEAAKIWVDGHNNPGFSGGPLIFIRVEDQFKKDRAYKVAGVISAYRVSALPVYNREGHEIGLSRENTGIVLANGIQPALDLINASPIGHELKGA